jgi:two-component system cell cycle response regulator
MTENALSWRTAGKDLRIESRQRTLSPGFIVIHGNSIGIECTIRDVSDDGARLRVENGYSLPSHFRLKTETDPVGCNCEVVWRKSEEVGIRFTDESGRSV